MNVLDAIQEQSALRGGAKISAVHLKIGPLSGVAPQALRSAFEKARQGTSFADCSLMIEETPVTIHCPECSADRPVESIQQLRCAVCGTAATTDVTTGRELEVCAMEIIS